MTTDRQTDSSMEPAVRRDALPVLDTDADDSSDRLAADRELFEMLQQAEFTGRVWDLFAAPLVEYGYSVLDTWARSGHIFRVAASSGLRLTSAPEYRQRLATDDSFREELVSMSVADALMSFRQNAIVGEGWRPNGGASLNTYFIRACLFTFANHYRRALRDHMKSPERGHRVDIDTVGDLLMRSEADIADQIAGQDAVRQVMEELSGWERQIVFLKLEGYSNHEIAAVLGIHRSKIHRHLKQLRDNRDWVARLADGMR